MLLDVWKRREGRPSERSRKGVDVPPVVVNDVIFRDGQGGRWWPLATAKAARRQLGQGSTVRLRVSLLVVGGEDAEPMRRKAVCGRNRPATACRSSNKTMNTIDGVIPFVNSTG
jgi:hypothetical protein